ncbi:DUF924 family protein [Aspergillus thermomutatus]|uniref:DUF924-domain-containing protein n=1 Tax=Aspergillus thermomutatus TaxID=41047 RepID=A0A397GMG8_ASPTH|nr:uncharacterized protein CDV56_102317 [Aspergillus thermomutatus]RHZ49180.1 hypothetical protein CDV56_102317 [Aspergillus thermomutatus]
MANEQTVPLDHLVPSLLPRVYDFWFQYIPSDERLVVPSPEDWKRWFMKSDEFDGACTSQFSPLLAAIRKASPSAEEILSRTQPSSPQDWLGLILLLDQLPRNIYRAESSRTVFEFFDPLARTIALRAADAGYPSRGPFRYRQAQRIWFYLPFIHSEDLRMQELARAKYQEMAGEITRLLDGDPTALSDDERACRRVLVENRERVEAQLTLHFRVQREHYDPVARFGRFPHRNAALGRVSSEEEKRFVEEGNTFGQ